MLDGITFNDFLFLFIYFNYQTEKLHAGTQFRVLGYYFANETAVAMRPSYIDNIVKAIKMMNNGACLLFEIDNDLMSSSDALILKVKT